MGGSGDVGSRPLSLKLSERSGPQTAGAGLCSGAPGVTANDSRLVGPSSLTRTGTGQGTRSPGSLEGTVLWPSPHSTRADSPALQEGPAVIFPPAPGPRPSSSPRPSTVLPATLHDLSFHDGHQVGQDTPVHVLALQSPLPSHLRSILLLPGRHLKPSQPQVCVNRQNVPGGFKVGSPSRGPGCPTEKDWPRVPSSWAFLGLGEAGARDEQTDKPVCKPNCGQANGLWGFLG